MYIIYAMQFVKLFWTLTGISANLTLVNFKAMILSPNIVAFKHYEIYFIVFYRETGLYTWYASNLLIFIISSTHEIGFPFVHSNFLFPPDDQKMRQLHRMRGPYTNLTKNRIVLMLTILIRSGRSMTCTNVWPDSIVNLIIKPKRIFTRFHLWGHILFRECIQKLMQPTHEIPVVNLIACFSVFSPDNTHISSCNHVMYARSTVSFYAIGSLYHCYQLLWK